MDRLTKLPDRDLTLSAELMELAWGDGTWIYLVSLTPTVGQPDDPTKEEYDLGVSVLDSTGASKIDYPRLTTWTSYDDPSPAIGTPTDYDPAAAIMTFAAPIVERMAASAARLLDQRPLYERLAAA